MLKRFVACACTAFICGAMFVCAGCGDTKKAPEKKPDAGTQAPGEATPTPPAEGDKK